MRGPAIPTPCSMRPAIITSKVCAKKLMTHPDMNKTRPVLIEGLRPILSERGPKTICPRPSPSSTAVTTN